MLTKLLAWAGAAAMPLALAACCTEPVYPGMKFIPAGEFKMGSDGPEAKEDEKPQKTVKLEKGFHIDIYEVTNDQYADFCKKTGRKPPIHWPGGAPPKGEEKFPVTNVTYYDAEAYARFHGKRLPTEQEWEYACRGSDGRNFPWGNEWRNDAANSFGAANAPNRPVAVDDPAYQAGQSPFGLWHMAGNVWEWTSTTAQGGDKVKKGGSYDIDESRPRCSLRAPAPADSIQDTVGFRTAADAQCD